jgi:flagellar hook-basal body complex protein FliE
MPGIAPVGALGVDALALYRSLPQYAPVQGVSESGTAAAAGQVAGTPAFGQMVAEKLGAAVELQSQGNAAAQAIATGQADDISAATIAVQKANIALQTVAAFRNKALEAYQEVLRMQV